MHKFLAFAALAASPALVSAASIDQWASSVVGFSSQYNTTGSWAAVQAVGAPNTVSYGDIGTSWAPKFSTGTLEYITLGYDTPVYATGAVVRETDNNGFVYRIDARDTAGNYHQVWAGTDPSLPGSPVNFTTSWATTSYLVNALKIYVNTTTVHHINNSTIDTWDEIDAVQLRGTDVAPSAVPTPAAATGALPLLAILGYRRFRKSR